jgi:hypothetical protein
MSRIEATAVRSGPGETPRHPGAAGAPTGSRGTATRAAVNNFFTIVDQDFDHAAGCGGNPFDRRQAGPRGLS